MRAAARSRRQAPTTRAALVVTTLLSLLWPVFVGCSSGPSKTLVDGCDPTLCAAGSQCIDDGTGHGASCQHVCTSQAQCPYEWYCNDGMPTSWCVPSNFPYPKAPGQWGASCFPSGDPTAQTCDDADTFSCYGSSPTDANAYCTFLDCSGDSDCIGGWWCAQVNVAPNLSSQNRSFGKTRNVCQPRQYCSPCVMDHDCPLAPDGSTFQHCVQDANGQGFCSPQCARNDTCPLDATCQARPWGLCAPAGCKTDGDCTNGKDAETCVNGACRVSCATAADCPNANGARQTCTGGLCAPGACASDDDCPTSAAGFFEHCNAGVCEPECGSAGDCDPDQACVAFSVCVPRAGVCVGDGTLCSPCRSDHDCQDGYCLEATNSTERFCSQAMTGTAKCSAAALSSGACPALPAGANYKAVQCTTASTDFSPANQCVGAVNFNGQQVPGCWTANR